VTCACCGYKTRAAYDENVIPSSPFGPRLMSIVVLLTGIYHVSRRKTAKKFVCSPVLSAARHDWSGAI